MLPRIAFPSPLPPSSGDVATRAAAVLPHLSRDLDVEIVGDRFPGQVSPLAGRPMRHWLELPGLAAACDGILYQIGDESACCPVYESLLHVPGVVELHAVELGRLYLAHFQARGRRRHFAWKLEDMHGRRGRALVPPLRRGLGGELTADALPLRAEVLGAAVGLVLHDESARRRLRGEAPSLPMLVVSAAEPAKAARAVAAFLLALQPLWRRRLETALARRADVRHRLVAQAARVGTRGLSPPLRRIESWSAAAQECFGDSQAAAGGG